MLSRVRLVFSLTLLTVDWMPILLTSVMYRHRKVETELIVAGTGALVAPEGWEISVALMIFH